MELLECFSPGQKLGFLIVLILSSGTVFLIALDIVLTSVKTIFGHLSNARGKTREHEWELRYKEYYQKWSDADDQHEILRDHITRLEDANSDLWEKLKGTLGSTLENK